VIIIVLNVVGRENIFNILKTKMGIILFIIVIIVRNIFSKRLRVRVK